MNLTTTQIKVLRMIGNSLNGMCQIGGNGMIGYLSSARALKRKGLLIEWKSSQFAITDFGRDELQKINIK